MIDESVLVATVVYEIFSDGLLHIQYYTFQLKLILIIQIKNCNVLVSNSISLKVEMSERIFLEDFEGFG